MNNGLCRWFKLNIVPMISGKNVLLSLCCYAPAVEEEMVNFRTDAANHKSNSRLLMAWIEFLCVAQTWSD